MNNLKLTLFNFRQSLSLDQEEVSRIVETYVQSFDKFSEKEIVQSLNERLEIYTYDKDVKALLENLNLEVANNPLVYDLKDLYKKLDRKNTGELYRHPLNIILTTINESDNDARMIRILNELAIHDWIPEVKHFILKLTASPAQKQNLTNSGKVDNVYTLVESVEGGNMVFVKDRWFLIGEGKLQLACLEDHVKDEVKLKKLRLMEEAIKLADFATNRVSFHIEEDLAIGLSTEDKTIFINEQKIEAETTLESIFASPIIPLLKKNFFPIVLEAMNNLDKFVDLDIAKKVTNFVNLYCEAYVFNVDGNLYLYDVDKRKGTSLFEYESAMELVNDVRRELDADITFFVEESLSSELKKRRKLEDREKEIKLNLDEINTNVEAVKEAIQEVGETDELKAAMNQLLAIKAKKDSELITVKNEILESTKAVVNN